MSIRKTNFIKPQRVQVEPVSIKRNDPVTNNRSEKLKQLRENREMQKAPRNNIHERKNIPLPRGSRKIQPVQVNENRQPAYDYQDIPKIWNGETVYIVGGGASLKDFDFNLLKDKKVIAINKAHQYVTNPTVLYWTDTRFYNWYKNEIDHLNCIKITVATNNRNYSSDVRVVKNERTDLMDFNSLKYINAANNSGFGALVLAIKMGAKKVYLLGYDMGHTSGKSHFHDGYPNLATSRENIYKSMLKHFESAKAKILSAAEVYNTNPKSALTAFPFRTIQEALLDS